MTLLDLNFYLMTLLFSLCFIIYLPRREFTTRERTLTASVVELESCTGMGKEEGSDRFQGDTLERTSLGFLLVS